ncbi:MAG: hypothetical protein KDE31_28275, partial [Caldilineaceae bacterium]|nr:hypothetical protein [Caldilineaceae bacterium]
VNLMTLTEYMLDSATHFRITLCDLFNPQAHSKEICPSASAFVGPFLHRAPISKFLHSLV